MTKRRFKVFIERDSETGAWVTYVAELGYLSTFGDSREEALEATHEAILGYLEAAAKEGLPVPPPGAESECVEVEVAVP